jgi:hypothetical protein
MADCCGHLGAFGLSALVTGDRPAALGLRFLGYSTRPSRIGYMAKQSKRRSGSPASCQA